MANASDFLEHLKATYRGAALTQMIELGHRNGLFDCLAVAPATSGELATRSDRSERQVREWLGAITVGGIVTYHPATMQYTLPPEHAFWLTGNRHTNLANMAGMLNGLTRRMDDVSASFEHGGGVPYEKYRPEFTCAMDANGRAKYDAMLVGTYLPKVPQLVSVLTNGARVADIGCGTGHCVNLMARAFPRSTFIGYDFSHEAIGLARDESKEMQLDNASFEVEDAMNLADQFDVVFAFDAIHDQANPAGVLASIRKAVKPGGYFMMLDINASSHLENNLENPQNAVLYSISVMHCMQVSLAGGGPGLGTVWGHELAHSMLNEAGFTAVERFDLEGDPTNCLYACR